MQRLKLPTVTSRMVSNMPHIETLHVNSSEWVFGDIRYKQNLVRPWCLKVRGQSTAYFNTVHQARAWAYEVAKNIYTTSIAC